MTNWVDNDMIVTEDGVVVREGDRVYDYYSMKAGVIVPGSITHAPDVWFDVRHDDGTRTILNGQRICTMQFARRRGFPGADVFNDDNEENNNAAV